MKLLTENDIKHISGGISCEATAFLGSLACGGITFSFLSMYGFSTPEAMLAGIVMSCITSVGLFGGCDPAPSNANMALCFSAIGMACFFIGFAGPLTRHVYIH